MATPIILGLLFLFCLALTWSLSLAESAFGYLSYREAEGIHSKWPKNPVLVVMDRLSEHQLAIRFWNALLLAISAVLATVTLDHFLNSVWLSALFGVLVMGATILLFNLRDPRLIGAKKYEATARATAWLVRFLTLILGPIPRLLIRDADQQPQFEYDETDLEEKFFREYVSRASQADVLEDEEAEMIQSVFEMDDTLVRSIMVPRTDIVWLDADTTLGKATEIFIQSGYSRIPLIGDNPDQIIGIVFLKDIVRAVHTGRLNNQDSINLLSREIRAVPESKTVWDLLQELQRESIHAAIVVDEYGGTAGLITLEDLIEELVGDISDEYDEHETADVVLLEKGVFIVNASMSVSDFAEVFNLLLDDDDDVDTVGGLFTKTLGKIPTEDAVTHIKNLTLTVDSLAGRRHRVDTIRVTMNEPTEESIL